MSRGLSRFACWICFVECYGYIPPCRTSYRKSCGSRKCSGQMHAVYTVIQRKPDGRRRREEKSSSWKGDAAGKAAGRQRAWRKYRDLGPCARCKKPATERHHISGNVLDNSPENIQPVCRHCHMVLDGRISVSSGGDAEGPTLAPGIGVVEQQG